MPHAYEYIDVPTYPVVVLVRVRVSLKPVPQATHEARQDQVGQEASVPSHWGLCRTSSELLDRPTAVSGMQAWEVQHRVYLARLAIHSDQLICSFE